MKDDFKIKYHHRTHVLGWILVGMLFCLFGVSLVIVAVERDIDASNVNNGVQFSSLVVGVLTVYYVFLTFRTQKEQIAEQREELRGNKKDVEFNRSIDIIFKQMDFLANVVNKDIMLNYLNTEHLEDNPDNLYTYMSENRRELEKSLVRVASIFRALYFAVHTPNISIADKNYLIKLVTHNYEFPFLRNLGFLEYAESLMMENSVDKKVTGLFLSLDNIKRFKEEVTEKNFAEKRDAANYLAGNENLK